MTERSGSDELPAGGDFEGREAAEVGGGGAGDAPGAFFLNAKRDFGVEAFLTDSSLASSSFSCYSEQKIKTQTK